MDDRVKALGRSLGLIAALAVVVLLIYFIFREDIVSITSPGTNPDGPHGTSPQDRQDPNAGWTGWDSPLGKDERPVVHVERFDSQVDVASNGGDDSAPTGRLIGHIEDRADRRIRGTVKVRRLHPQFRDLASDQLGRFPILLTNELLTVGTDHLGAFAIDMPPGRYVVWAEAKDHGPSRTRWWVGVSARKDTRLTLEVRPTSTLRGVVLALDEQPINGARITVSAGKAPFRTRSSGDGVFEVPGLPEGAYQVRAVAKGYMTEIQTVAVTEELGGVVVLRLLQGGRIEGTVRDADGRPFPDAWLHAHIEGREYSRTRSDAEGRYAFDSLPPTRITVLVRSDNRVLVAKQDIELEPGSLEVHDVILREALAIRGTLTNDRGDPISGLAVYGRGGKSLLRQSRSDGQGQYVLKGLYPGTYTLTVSGFKRPFAPLLTERVEVTDIDVTRDLVVPSRADLSGVVLDREGKPLAGAIVYTLADSKFQTSTRTDAEGRFVLSDVSPREYQVCAVTKSRRWTACATVALTKGSREGLKLQVGEPTRLVGKLLDPDGRPVAGADLELLGWKVMRTRTRADGSYVVSPVLPGTYRLTVVKGSLLLVARKGGFQPLQVLDPQPLLVGPTDQTVTRDLWLGVKKKKPQ